VSAYDDEKSLDVTLLEGSVKVSNGDENVLIAPGQQAALQDSRLTIHNNVDIEEVMAWKNGLFSYKGADVETIMRQVSRWYNVNVVFEEPVHEKFYAQVSRNTNVSKLLKMLEATRAVHFNINGKTITVRP
jgi:ferric-dicitrate binding protein FerR (iron transport regulator)